MDTDSVSYTREQLYELVWAEPMTKLAEKLGLSDGGLRKRCRKLNIPLPPQGHWLRKQFGKEAERPPLPPLANDDKVEIVFNGQKNDTNNIEEPEEVAVQNAFEKHEQNKIIVPLRLSSPHPLIVRYKQAITDVSRYETDRGRIHKYGEILDITASRGSMDRALRLLNSLLKALDARSYPVSILREDAGNGSASHKTIVSVLGERVAFGLREGYSLKKFDPTKGAKRAGIFYETYPGNDYMPSGQFTLTIKEYVGGDIRLVWSDGKRQKLENCLNEFIVGLARAAVGKRNWRQKREREERERREREIRWYEDEQLRKKQEAELQALLQEAANWRSSNLIREYASAVKENAVKQCGTIEAGSELDRWLEWAASVADRIDPLEKIAHE
jgi:hypothetical protein